MQTFIAGIDAHKYDLSDWDVNPIPVYFNPTGIPATITADQVEEMIRQACDSWSLWYSHKLVYMGRTDSIVRYESMVINYANSAHLWTIVPTDVGGLCRYHVKDHLTPDGKHILWGAEIYMNSDTRPFADNFAQATMTHEVGHGCGIHGHLNKFGCVMNVSSMGHCKLTLDDVQMLDHWNPYPVQLNKDLSLSCPAVHMPDGLVKWVDLKYTGSALQHSWSLAKETPWAGPVLDNVTVGGPVDWHGYPGQRISMKSVRGQGLDLSRVDLVLLQNGNIVLEYAE